MILFIEVTVGLLLFLHCIYMVTELVSNWRAE